MAITNYNELDAAITAWVIKNYGDTRIGEFIALGEAHLNRELRYRDMEQTADLSLTASTQTVSLPTRYVGARRLYLDLSPVRRLRYMAPVDFWSKFVSIETGTPSAYTVEGDTLVFGPIPDTTYTGKFLYWQAFPALDADTQTTNDLLTNHPDAYLAASLVWAFTFKDDDQNIAKWTNILRGIIDSIQDSDEKDRFPAGDLVVRNDSGNPPQFG